jgi:hypothetical protein
MTTNKPQVTPLTPNCFTSTVGAGDTNNTTAVQFVTSNFPCFSRTVSDSNPKWVLSEDCDRCPSMVFNKGLTITFVSSGGAAYNVFLFGTIVDNGQEYSFEGMVLYMSPGREAAEAPAEKT